MQNVISFKMAVRGGNFVPGEASESEEEYEIDQSYFMKNTMVMKQDTAAVKRSIVVEGEASESDEDESENMPTGTDEVVKAIESGMPSQESSDGGVPSEQTKRTLKFHYDSAFHRRLRVSNLELRSDIIDSRRKIYDDANRKLQSALFYLNRSQAYSQDILSNFSLVSGDLQTIADSLEKIVSRDFLPTLQMANVEKRTIKTLGTQESTS